MSIVDQNYSEASSRMEKTIESLKKDLGHIRTGRASPSVLDGIKVDYYGSMMPVNQVATISVPEARTIIVQPWEKQMIPVIEKAIKASDLGLNPQSDANLIRVPIPPLSEERRKELVKTSKRIAEENKVAIRNIRRDANDRMKKAEKDKEVTQDDARKALDEIQKLTDKQIENVDKILAVKEKEIMEV